MPKQGGFKRAVRQRARETGQRYTEARAAMDKRKENYPAFVRSVEHAPLKAHLEERYGIRITSMAPIVASGMTYSGTLRVEREVGPAWVVSTIVHVLRPPISIRTAVEILGGLRG